MPRLSTRTRALWLGPAIVVMACGGGDSSHDADGGALDAGAGSSGSGGSIGGGSGGDRGSGDASGGGSGSSGGLSGDGGQNPVTDASTQDGAGSVGRIDAGPIIAPQPLSPYIVVDQFGYRPGAEKIAVARVPQTGFDAPAAFSPGAKYALVDAHDTRKVLEAAPVPWNGGAVDPSSGDKAWWFDFSSVTTPGDYFVLDEANGVRSDVFGISDTVYRDVLAQSVRMLFYQRDGFAKTAQFTGAGWADGASHMGALQDPHCRLYSSPGDVTTERDVHGGWFDAGDDNKYTNFGASYVIELLRAYTENPTGFRDDYGIPESGNGIPDVLDEIKWEVDWLLRMQNADGSVLSIVGEDGTSPPSSSTKPSLHGPASTSASLSTTAALAYAAMVFGAANPQFAQYAAQLKTVALSAWVWAQQNPAVVFANTGKVGAGEQEVDAAYGLPMRKLEGALYLFELTSDTTYRDFFDANYTRAHMIANGNYIDLFDVEVNDTLLEYTKSMGATPAVVQNIKNAYKAGMNSGNNLGSLRRNADPYLAYVPVYTWGSNQNKAGQGNVFYDVISFGIDAPTNADAARGAERYVHYIHGVNPLQMVYLSNMAAFGAQKSVGRFFHSWFTHGSPLRTCATSDARASPCASAAGSGSLRRRSV